MGPNRKNLPRIKLNNRKIDHPCACNSLKHEHEWMKWPDTEIVWICWNPLKLVWKISWNHIKLTYFWRVLPVWNLCASGRRRAEYFRRIMSSHSVLGGIKLEFSCPRSSTASLNSVSVNSDIGESTQWWWLKKTRAINCQPLVNNLVMSSSWNFPSWAKHFNFRAESELELFLSLPFLA